ncbi:MAG: type II CAAX prenyl endopeptidase Rce1 family protein [Bacteroidota bacterium]
MHEITDVKDLPESAALERQCVACGHAVSESASFCSACGKPIEHVTPGQLDAMTVLTPTLIYYFVTLLLLGIYKFTNVWDSSFESTVVVTIFDVAIVVIFWILYGRSLAPLFSFKNVRIKIVLLVMLGCVAGAVVVHYLAAAINVAINDHDVFYDYLIFGTTDHPKLFAVLFICVQPAIFEEVAFRGFLFNNVQQLTTQETTVYVTSFMFGVLHLAFLSLFWLVPIGLAFAFLRKRYNTLWYGIVGHFTYNFIIIFFDYINLNFL